MIAIPIKVQLDLSENEEEAFDSWLNSSQELIIKANMKACHTLAMNETMQSVDVVYIYDINETDDAMPVFELSITREDVILNLNECESYFVDEEDYESAALAVQYKKYP